MGKVAIILVLCTGVIAAHGLASRVETGRHTAEYQADFEEAVIAREIARSGFNIAMGIIREHGDSLQAGVLAVNGSQGYLEGQQQGGVFHAKAKYISGHAIEVSSTGYFGGQFVGAGTAYEGGATHTMEDSYTYRVTSTPLQVKECSLLKTEFLQSEAGYCSAVYLQRILPDTDPADQPKPEMIFAPGNYRTGAGMPISKKLAGGTLMNFFIGVSKGCKPYDGTNWYKNDLWKHYDAENHEFDKNDYDHVHYAFEDEAMALEDIKETPWAMVEQHPANNQRWRIGWEDLHRTDWDKPNSQDPKTSLQALKQYGYAGDGWPSTDGFGYRTLVDYPSRPDFSDQVVDVSLSALPIEDCVGVPGGPPPPPPPDPTPEPEDDEYSEPDFSSGGCACPGGKKNHKVLVFHRPPGNPDNGKFICVGKGAAKAHTKNHDDYIQCQG